MDLVTYLAFARPLSVSFIRLKGPVNKGVRVRENVCRVMNTCVHVCTCDEETMHVPAPLEDLS